MAIATTAPDAAQNAAPAGFNGTLTDKLREQFAEGLDGQTLRADFTMQQPVHRYTAADHATWRTLYDRQEALLPGRVCDEFLQGLSTLGMSRDAVPSFDQLNETLMRATGWQIVAVPGLVPDEVFFDHLANRRFPASWWMRRPDQLDYLQEPDCFHDIFGHVPLLINPIFADYMEAYGKGGLKAARLGQLDMLARLYWYTVEFGLIRDASGDASAPDGVKIYGAGIVSSKGESLYSVESAAPNRLAFDLERVLRTRYRIDTFQKTYFVIDSFAQLFDALGAGIASRLADPAALIEAPPHAAGDVLQSDTIITRGTREGWLDDGDV